MINLETYYLQFKPMVHSIAKKFFWIDSVRTTYYEDLIAEGELGLMVALNKLDLTRDTDPSSYIFPYISGYMNHFVRSYIFSQPSNPVSIDLVQDAPDGSADCCILSEFDPEYQDLTSVDDIVVVFKKWLNSDRSDSISKTVRNHMLYNIDKIRSLLQMKSEGLSLDQIITKTQLSKRTVYQYLGYIHMCLEDLNFLWADQQEK